jgi:hypothetical protein
MSKKPVKKPLSKTHKVVPIKKTAAAIPPVEAPKQPPLSDVLLGIRGLILAGSFPGSHAANVVEATNILQHLSINQKAGEDKAAAEVTKEEVKTDGEEKDS